MIRLRARRAISHDGELRPEGTVFEAPPAAADALIACGAAVAEPEAEPAAPPPASGAPRRRRQTP